MSASQSMTQALGYTWDQSAVPHDVPRFSVERAVWRLRRSLPEYVWDAAVLEGNPFTYPEVQTLLDGITVGGRKISDERQVLNLAEAANELLRLVNAREFRLDKEISDRLQYLIARDEALESGHFRGGGERAADAWGRARRAWPLYAAADRGGRWEPAPHLRSRP